LPGPIRLDPLGHPDGPRRGFPRNNPPEDRRYVVEPAAAAWAGPVGNGIG